MKKERRKKAGSIVALGVMLTATALAQRVRPRPDLADGAPPARSGPADDAPVLIEPSAPILNLFARAQEGIDRRDWKFAIDSLQRIVNEPGGSLMPRPGKLPSDVVVYESTRRRALRMLLELPPEALAAYRILYDGKAKRLYEQALASGDVHPLREILDRYPLTHYGDDACDLLASWLIDEGRYGETIDVLQDCLSIVPEFDVPRALLYGKLAAALTVLGRTREAQDVIEDMRQHASDEPPTSALVEALEQGVIHPGVTVAAGDSSGRGRDVRVALLPGAPLEPLNATLIDPVPWRYDLPGSEALIWKRVKNIGVDDPVTLPAIQAVSDGRRLYVRRPNGCAALDVDDLQMLWEASADAASDGDGRSGSDDARGWPSGGGFDDFVGGALSLAEGLLFTIEWRGPSTSGSSPVQQFNRFVQRTRVVSANRLVAYDPETGEVVWQRGRTFDPEDPLGEVEFRAAPLGVEGRLWVPVVVQSDMYLAVLDPADGTLLHQMLLGSFQNFDRLFGRVLNPVARDGLVFVPSGRGVVFAIDAHSLTLRWATRYEVPSPIVETWHQQQLRFRAQVQRNLGDDDAKDDKPDRVKVPVSPVVARGLVLILGEEDRELVALSATDGSFRWSTPSPNASYILGADDERIWLAGRALTCISLRDGAILWETPIPQAATGWGLIAGDAIQIPSSAGLLSFDRMTGESLGAKPMPPAQTPLGNLLAVGHSLISIDPSSVRKFPDIARTFDDAVRAFERNPRDIRAALRLAWMQLFRGAPDQTYQALRGLSDSILEAHPKQAEAVVHLRVTALLAMAKARGGEEALGLLEEAKTQARSPDDRLRAGLAVADQLHALGRSGAAYESLWSLGLDQAAERTITINDTVQTAARLEIARRMRALESEATEAAVRLTEDGLALVQRAASEAREKQGPLRRASIAALRAMAELGTPPEVAGQALMHWADIEAVGGRFERADQLLRWSHRLSRTPETAIAVLLRLYAVYREEMGPEGAPTQDMLHVLERDYSDFVVTDELAQHLKTNGTGAFGTLEAGTTIGDWVRSIRIAAGSTGADGPPQAVWNVDQRGAIRLVRAWELAPKTFQTDHARAPFSLSGDLRQSLEGVPVAETPRMIHFEQPAYSFMNDRVLFHAGGDIVYCQRPRDGGLLWQTTLRRPQEFTESINVNRGRAREGARRAVSDGQIAVINGTDGLYAIGVVTGRRLWVRPYETPSRTGTESAIDWRMDARDGLLAAMPGEGRLTLMRLVDGSTVWERDLRGEVVGLIRLTEDRVVVADPKLERVLVFDRSDGAEVSRHFFQQPDPDSRPLMLVVTGDVLCAPDATPQGDSVAGVALESGEELWRTVLRKPVVSLTEPASGLVGIGMLGGDLQIVEAETGVPVFDQHLSGVHAVQDVRVVDATLVVQASTLQTARRQPVLIGIDLATGAEVWRRSDLARGPGMQLPLVVNEGVAPALVSYEEAGRNQNQSRSGLALIDVKTGETAALARDVVLPGSRAELRGEVAVWRDAAVLGTSVDIRAYRAAVMNEEDLGS